MQSSAKDGSDCVGQGNAENGHRYQQRYEGGMFQAIQGQHRDHKAYEQRSRIPQKNRGRIEVEGQKAQQTRDQKENHDDCGHIHIIGKEIADEAHRREGND